MNVKQRGGLCMFIVICGIESNCKKKTEGCMCS